MNEVQANEGSRQRSEVESRSIDKPSSVEEGSKGNQLGKLEAERSNHDNSMSAGLPRSERERKGTDVQWRRSSTQKEERKISKDDSDYVRDSTESTSSGGSSSASGYVAGKIRRVPRAVRNKNTEVRRNPLRVKKKIIDKDFTRPRQRLLTAKRKAALGELEFGKRGKQSTMPYMNTRSVTRKMYNVGATYQAPTKRDETEWKEWPAHGMHERPVFHPQVGLAAEYLGKYFTSTDGFSYREIIDQQEIEVVSVDPRSSSIEKKRSRKSKLSKDSLTSTKDFKSTVSEEKSFVSCMHNSLHCVLGYCSQIASPNYKTKLQEKDADVSLNLSECKKDGKESKEIIMKDSYALAATKTSTSQTLKPLPRLFPMQTMYVTNSQKSISFTNVKTLEASGIKVQEVLRPSAKNPLILVNASEAKSSSSMRGRILKPVPNNLNLIKLDNNSINEDSIVELSPIYKNVAGEVSTSIPDTSKPSSRSTPMKSEKTLEFAVSKCRFAREKKDKQSVEANDFDSSIRNYSGTAMSNKTWPTTDASEIAKILSDYNKSATKNSENPNYTYPGNYGEELEYPKASTPKRNLSIKFPQGKWRRFHFTVEKMKKSSNNENSDGKIMSLPGKQVVQRTSNSQTKPTSTAARNQSLRLDEEVPRVQPLQELLENTAALYCAATGVHQEDLAEYINSLDSNQSAQWLEEWNNASVQYQ